ncbi:MAG: hypothetical protein KDD82_28280 [Planctomycetes bacterium]|nr:hypothetical protein [Planctomycetota bacterium]
MRSFATALTLLACAGLARAQSEAPQTYDWVLHYYMAYDNNLERCGPPIVDMLAKGITSEKLAIVVSADYADTKGMRRYLLTKGERKVLELEEEGSAEEETLAAELDWVRQSYPAKKYAVVFLNHGGGLGQMSLDERPGKQGGQTWLYPPEVARVVTAWREQVKAAEGEVELVFYQQCGKGSLENYHCMRTAARYVMGSQTVVGAPNYYYSAAIEHLCEHPEADGLELAKQITQHETANMFTTYTTLDSAQLDELPAQLDAVLAPLLALEALKLPRLGSKELPPCFDFGKRELFFDGMALFRALYAANELDPAPLAALEDYHRRLIPSHRVSPQQQTRAGTWCGYSVFFPLHPRVLEQYEDYPIYADTQLDEFFAEVFRQAAARRAARETEEGKGAPR